MMIPKKEYLNNSKVANFISANSDLYSTEMKLNTIPQKQVSVSVSLFADEKITFSNPNITQYDRAVMDAVYTLVQNGETTFTPETIVRIMSGNMQQDASPQKVEAVKTSIRKLSVIRIRIDCTDELKVRRKIAKDQKAKLESYLLPVESIEVISANHITMTGFRLLRIPALYEYAEKVGQIIDVPLSLLDTSKDLFDTDEVVVMKRYLIRRIEMMKNGKNRVSSRRIRYEWYDSKKKSQKGILPELSYHSSDFSNWREKKRKLHKMITSILKAFVKKGYINGFSVFKEGKSIGGYDIEL